jgi:hypothetical protein
MLLNAVLIAGGVTILPEIISAVLYLDHHFDDYFHGAGCAFDLRLFRLLQECAAWLMTFYVHLKTLSIISATAGCLLLLRRISEADPAVVGGGVAAASLVPESDEGAAQTLLNSMELVLALLGMALFTQISYLMNTILTPFRKLGVFMLTVNRMLRDDIMTFLVLFVLIFVAFYSMLFTVYPRTGEEALPQATAFNDWAQALEALVYLSFMGEPPEVAVDKAAFDALSMPQQVNYGIFLSFYTFFILVGMVLLLNLLIAMLSNTFNAVQMQQVLAWRLERARRCLRLELLAGQNCLMGEEGIRIGEEQGGDYYYPFRHVSANIEGVAVSGGVDLFEDLDVGDEATFEWNKESSLTCASMGGFQVPPPTPKGDDLLSV